MLARLVDTWCILARAGVGHALTRGRVSGELESQGFVAVRNWAELHGRAFRGAKVLVTGGAGVIGSHLAEALAQLGATVVVLDDLSGGSRENLASFGPVQFVHGSILDREILSRCTRECRYVFHQAALGS